MPPLVLALNPCVDVEWRVAQVRWDEKNEIRFERRWPGGKGVNVARWLTHLGCQPLLLLPLGGATGHELAGGLRAEGIATRAVPLRSSTRANVIVTASRGRQLRFNAPGPRLSAADWGSILAQTTRALRRASVLILSGSLPPGLTTRAYAKLLRLAQRAGVPVLLDCDGPAFVAGAAARPFLVKPNRHELAQWSRRPLRSAAAVEKAAHELAEVTRGWVLVSLGEQGALLVHHRQPARWTASSPKVKAVNTVGAGDALLAAVAWQMAAGAPAEDWLRWGSAAGAAAVACRGGQLPSPRRLAELARRVHAVCPGGSSSS